MNKYHAYLAENYTRKIPFTTDWNYELLGDKLRAEFDEWFAQKEKEANAGVGKSKQLFKGELIKQFMVQKRVNLVDDPATGNLKSVFIIRLEEKKLIDERAKDSLEPRFGYKTKKSSDGTETEPLGFIKFELVEGEESKEKSEEESFQVQGNDVEYFKDEEPSKEEEFICEVCGKKFDSKRALHAHSLSHKKE